MAPTAVTRRPLDLGLPAQIIGMIFTMIAASIPVRGQPIVNHGPHRRPYDDLKEDSDEDLDEALDPTELHDFLESLQSNQTMPPVKQTTIAFDMYKEVRAAVAKEPWMKDRDFRINPRTKSISIFDGPISLSDDDGTQIARLPVPLYYQGLPVIAHAYPLASNPFIPPSFALSDAEASGPPTVQQIKRFRQFLRCRIHVVDVYLDDEITFGVEDEQYPNTYQRLDDNSRFQAYGYHCRIVPMSKITTPPSTLERDEDEDVVVGLAEIQPGTSVRNDSLEFSKIGILLARQGSLKQSPMSIYEFTVSNHSFIRKISLTWSLTLANILMYFAIFGLVYFPAKSGIVPIVLHVQFVTIRLLLTLAWAVALMRGRTKRIIGSEFQSFNCDAAPFLVFDLIFSIPIPFVAIVTWYLRQFTTDFEVLGFSLEWLLDVTVSCLIYKTMWRPVIGVTMLDPIDNEPRTERAQYGVDLFTWNTRQGPQKVLSPSLSRRFWNVTDCEVDSLILPFQIISYLGMAMNIVARVAWPANCVYGSFCLRLMSFGIFAFDIVECAWSWDIPQTWTLLGERVLNKEKESLATITKNLDPNASRENPHLARNDVAIARFKTPLILPRYNTLPWFNGEAPLGSRVIMIGKDDIGLVHYGQKKKRHVEIESLQRGLVSGKRYLFDVFQARSVEYHSAIIWRSNSRSVRGESGSCVVLMEENTVQVVGLQSHEFSDFSGVLLERPQYLKIAYRPPSELIYGYHAICPTAVLRRIREAGRLERENGS